MRINLLAWVPLVFVFSMLGCERKPAVGELEGSVFIVTKGRENIKLGLVTVSLYDAEKAQASILSFLKKIQLEANDIQTQTVPLTITLQKLSIEAKPIAEENDVNVQAKGRLTPKWEAKRDEMNRIAREFNNKIEPLDHIARNFERLCYEAIDHPVASVKTDADGKFRMQIPPNGKFVITASASRATGNQDEEYIWVVPVSLEGKLRGEVFLSNDNMASSDSTESMIPKLPFKTIPKIPLLQ